MAARSLASRLVVCDVSVPPVVSERVSEVHVGAEVLEQVGGPVPAIGGFEDHVGLGPGNGRGLGELEGLADEAYGAEHLAVFCHPDDGGAATMQVDPTYCPMGPPPLSRLSFARPSMLGSHEGRRPRPFIASGRVGQQALMAVWTSTPGHA